MMANDHDYHVLTLLHISIPAREETGPSKSGAGPNGVRIEERLRYFVPMLREKIGMLLGDMPFALLRPLNLASKIGTG